jgi:uncharacterized membrane protein YkvA (DUF1232 family)
MALSSWRARARQLKQETYALWLAIKDPRVPWYARLLGACVVGYALSPIDLIPDFIPVLGYLDDLIVVPLGIALLIRLIPPPVLAESRAAARAAADRPTSRAAAAVVVTIWLLFGLLAAWLLWQAFRSRA